MPKSTPSSRLIAALLASGALPGSGAPDGPEPHDAPGSLELASVR